MSEVALHGAAPAANLFGTLLRSAFPKLDDYVDFICVAGHEVRGELADSPLGISEGHGEEEEC